MDPRSNMPLLFPTETPTLFSSRDESCSVNEYFALSCLVCVRPLRLIYCKLIPPSSADRINRFLMGCDLVSTTRGSKSFRNVNECAGRTPVLSSLGSPSSQHVAIWVARAHQHPRPRTAAGVLLPPKSSAFASLAPTPLCFVPFLIHFGHWKHPLHLLLSFPVPLASGRKKQARISHNLTNTHELPRLVLPPRSPPSSFPRCFFSKGPGVYPVPLLLLPPSLPPIPPFRFPLSALSRRRCPSPRRSPEKHLPSRCSPSKWR